jgi:uncharacterized membrane protein
MENLKIHPKFRALKISDKGEFFNDGKPVRVIYRDYKDGRKISVICYNRTYYSAAKLILEAWSETTPSGRVYASFKDGNKQNLKLSNLFWSSTNLTKEQQFKRDCKLSKLDKEALSYIHRRKTRFNQSLSELSKILNVSPTTISRAFQRLEKSRKD